MRDLNSAIPAHSGWELLVAQAINDRGQIVGVDAFEGSNILLVDATGPSAP
jgi:hypothetical protein